MRVKSNFLEALVILMEALEERVKLLDDYIVVISCNFTIFAVAEELLIGVIFKYLLELSSKSTKTINSQSVSSFKLAQNTSPSM